VSTNLTTGEYLKLNFLYPTIFYSIWMFCYFIVNFIISWEIIEKRKYNTLYLWFAS